MARVELSLEQALAIAENHGKQIGEELKAFLRGVHASVNEAVAAEREALAKEADRQSARWDGADFARFIRERK